MVEKKLNLWQKSEGIGWNLIQIGGAQMIVIIPEKVVS